MYTILIFEYSFIYELVILMLIFNILIFWKIYKNIIDYMLCVKIKNDDLKNFKCNKNNN